MQRRVQRPVLDEQQVVRVALDGLDDAVAVEGAELKGAQDEEVERALEELDAVNRLRASHGRESTIYDVLPSPG